MSNRLDDVVRAALRKERRAQELTQAELGERLGWSERMVWNMERGTRKVTFGELPALCEALGVTLPGLLQGADPKDVARLGL